ncbi:thiolase family protein [Desulfosudis oleivorans]|uniref:Acetyl-CoA acetyltransferase n=1 Tax=Desulfosudis oleivorans (strain DSM 6200 / JCM 39069 / Hxd3) TaxID=96561 RepID=A8ZUD2_DESOH|nr:acetyl-CoA C-acyltransferase [Desulfosudis oleivorans]ABW67964.1 acetyl-CoA acetyltransferase [Desulfosudis oleivorans Hxd3]
MKDVVIVSACRTAIGAFGGTLKNMHASRIASIAMKEAIRRAGIDAGIIDDIRFGCCLDPTDSMNVTRTAALLAGIPDSVPAVTINRVCISGMEATLSGMAMIQAGMADVLLTGGVEHMSGVPYVVQDARWGCRLQDTTFVDALIRGLHCGSHIIPHPEDGPLKTGELIERLKGKPYIMGHTAEMVAELYNISREEMDEVALRSHNNVERATKEGDFAEEIVPVEIPQKKGKPPVIFDKDEHFRPGLTMEQLTKLPPAFVPGIGKVTAGNSSGLNDGAAAMVIMSADKAKELGLKPLAKIVASGRGACHPSVMGISPVPAVKNMFDKHPDLSLDAFELIELNEAFAAQYLGCEKELGLNREITNVNGSGIGLGHPVGCTGARIIVSLIHAMKKRGKSVGMATLCGGGGVSMATAVEML